MKKQLTILLIGIILLSGCSKQENKKHVCSAVVDDMQDTMVLTAEGDRVVFINEEIKLNWSDYEIATEEEKDIFESMMLEAFASLKETEGVKLDSRREEESLLILIEIDTQMTDYGTLKEMGMIVSENTEVAEISLEDSIAQLLNAGYECEIQK